MQRLQGDGWAFVHAGGTLHERTLAPGEVLRVDTGCIVALPADGRLRHPVRRQDQVGAVRRRGPVLRDAAAARAASGCSRCRSAGWRTASSPPCPDSAAAAARKARSSAASAACSTATTADTRAVEKPACQREKAEGTRENSARSDASRSRSSSFVARPTDARRAPTAVAKAVAKAADRERALQAGCARAASMPKACSAAPGLQKQPPRIAMPRSRAARSTTS